MDVFTGLVLEVKIKSSYLELLIGQYSDETRTIKVNKLSNKLTSELLVGKIVVCYKTTHDEMFQIKPLNDLI